MATQPNQFSHLYENKIILAPMVRANNLPFRLTCLQHGADIVYSEEIIDHALSICERVQNETLNCVDYVNIKTGRVMFRTCPEETQRLVLQMGSNCPERALKTAKLVSQDVMGIDFNFGCPKSFSIKGGMGAAMLNKPDEIEALLTTCTQNLSIPVTCKIRILPDLERTIKLVKLIESCGVAAIAVHGRTKDQRPNHECDTEVIRAISESISIPVIANGGSNHIRTFQDILDFKQKTGASSVMIARAAMKNPSIFRPDGIIQPIQELIPEYLKLAVVYDNYLSYTKYSINAMLTPSTYGGEFAAKFQRVADMRSMCQMFNLDKTLLDKIQQVEVNKSDSNAIKVNNNCFPNDHEDKDEVS